MVKLRPAPTIAIKNKNLHKSNLSNGPISHASPLKLSLNIQNNPNDLALASFPQEISTKDQSISHNRDNFDHQLSIISHYPYISNFLEETK